VALCRLPITDLAPLPIGLIPGCRQCAQNSPDCGPTDVRHVFIEVPYDGLREAPANVEGALRDPAI